MIESIINANINKCLTPSTTLAFLITNRKHHQRHMFDVNKFLFFFSGLLLLCQHHYCDELSTPSSLAPSSELAARDLTTTSKPRETSSTQHDSALHTKTSAISTSSTHTTRLHRITGASSDESIIDVTTSIDSLCLAKSSDADADTTDQNYSIKSISGDIIVTIILRQADNATEIVKFIVNHINEIDLLVHNVSLGEFFFLHSRV